MKIVIITVETLFVPTLNGYSVIETVQMMLTDLGVRVID